MEEAVPLKKKTKSRRIFAFWDIGIEKWVINAASSVAEGGKEKEKRV